MPQAIANPEELRRFAAELKQVNNQLRENTSRLQAQFVRLGDTWRDQEHQKFTREGGLRPRLPLYLRYLLRAE